VDISKHAIQHAGPLYTCSEYFGALIESGLMAACPFAIDACDS